MSRGIFHFSSTFNRKCYKQTVKLRGASDLSLHCLHLTQKLDVRLILVYPAILNLLSCEPHHEKTCLGFLTRSDTNRAVQPQKIARGLKFRI